MFIGCWFSAMHNTCAWQCPHCKDSCDALALVVSLPPVFQFSIGPDELGKPVIASMSFPTAVHHPVPISPQNMICLGASLTEHKPAPPAPAMPGIMVTECYGKGTVAWNLAGRMNNSKDFFHGWHRILDLHHNSSESCGMQLPSQYPPLLINVPSEEHSA